MRLYSIASEACESTRTWFVDDVCRSDKSNVVGTCWYIDGLKVVSERVTGLSFGVNSDNWFPDVMRGVYELQYVL